MGAAQVNNSPKLGQVMFSWANFATSTYKLDPSYLLIALSQPPTCMAKWIFEFMIFPKKVPPLPSSLNHCKRSLRRKMQSWSSVIKGALKALLSPEWGSKHVERFASLNVRFNVVIKFLRHTFHFQRASSAEVIRNKFIFHCIVFVCSYICHSCL